MWTRRNDHVPKMKKIQFSQRVPRVNMCLVGASQQDGVEIGFRQGHSNRN
jgi:hypothetical protein